MTMSRDSHGRTGTAWATIRDVAARAGVSVSTASKALSNKDQVAAVTKQRVLDAAAELHFAPNALIRSLQRGQTRTVGVLAWPMQTNTTMDITMSLLKGVADGVAATSRDLLLYSQTPASKTAVPVSTFLDGRVDGVVLGPGVLSESNLRALASSGLPAVVMYRGDVPEQMGSVTVDNEHGIESAVAHLVALGHRRIACCIPCASTDLIERLSGYKTGLAIQGIAFDADLVVSPSEWLFDVASAADALFHLSEPPTALIAGDDHIAFRWIEHLKARGLSIPGDISIIGFDDSAAAGMGSGLTTVRQPAQEVGCLAGVFVDRLIAGIPAEECRAELPVELIVRGTTGPAKPCAH